MTLHVLVLLTFGIVCLAFGGTGRTASSGSRGPEPAMAIARCFRPGRALASTVTISALALVGGALPDSAGATTTAGTGTDCSYDHRRPQRAEARETIRVVHALAQGSAALTPCPAPSPSTSADRPGVATNSPRVDPAEIAGKTPAEIDAIARQKGLVPKGPDPASGEGSYVDPVTGQQRVLCHLSACPPHAHVNNPAGERLDLNGNVVAPESPEAHLPLGTRR